MLNTLDGQIDVTLIPVREMGLEIRNFPDERYVVKITPSEEVRRQVALLARMLGDSTKREVNDRTVQAA
jgi:hypothetical protein